ncbi:MAG: hypothetical protein KDE51_22265, partial [Anaerolineales bacterium]|nr:hypothetical protein [Anaerolineales bacterium]
TFYDAAGLEIEAVAYSTGGNSSTETITHVFDNPGQPMQLAILTPAPGASLLFDGASAPAGTNVDVVVWAQQYDWQCTTDGRTYGNYPGLRCTDANPRPVSQMRLSLSNNVVGTYTPAANEYLHLFDVDLEGLSALLRPLTLRVTGEDGHFEEVSQPYILEQGVPLLEFDRSVSHTGSLYTIELTVHNIGSGTATIKQIRDLLHGFVALDKSTAPGRDATGYYEVSSTYDQWWTGSGLPNVLIDFTSAEIPPNDSLTVTYEAVPIIYESPFVDAYHIGHDEEGDRSDILYTYDGSSFNTLLPFSAPGNMIYEPSLGQSIPLLNAVLFYTFPTSDYLLITSPPRLNATAARAEQIPALMSDLAKLAKETNAIIAHAGLNPTAQAVDDLLEPGGYWYTMMHPNFREVLGGYVLFIGEDEVIPVQGGGWGVDFSDLRYASTGGAARPELVLGRITGDNIANMRKPIQAATIFHRNGSTFDSSHALLWSGSGDGEGTFWNDTKAMSSILVDTGASYSRFRSSDYESEVDLRPLLYQNSAGKDWIIYRGHGYRQGFADIGEHAIHVNTTNNLNMSPNRPIVLALACTTGDFVNGDDDWSINESFLANGAAVFLGSTETSSRARNSSAARGIFNRWHSGRSIGIVMARLMRDKWGDSSWTWPDDATWERWIYDYQIFGDPKYGEGVSALDQDPITIQAGDQYLLANNALANTLNISLPDLEVSLTDEGWHYVSLPDGDRMALQGEYAVPIFSATYHYPAGQRVQDVTLDLRGGLVISTGLNIDLNYFELDDGLATAVASSGSSAASADGWYPEMSQPFTWRVFENADGSSDLHLTVYPFSYHPA